MVIIGTDIQEVTEEILDLGTDTLEVIEEIVKPEKETLEVVTTDPEIGPMETGQCLEIEARKVKRTTKTTGQAQENMINPEDHMTDQNLLIIQETGTEQLL